MSREIRVSPDGDGVAIRTDVADPEARDAWGVMMVAHGGSWARTSQLADWVTL